MNSANRAFYAMVVVVFIAAAAFGAAMTRRLHPLLAGTSSTAKAVVHWCLSLLTGSPGIDELLLLGLFVLPTAALALGLSSLWAQWWATRRLLQDRTASRLRHLPRHLARLSQRLALTDRIDVVRATEPYAFCYGLVRPRICMSTGLLRLLSKAELEAVLLHERYHLRSHDPLKVLVTQALSRACCFLAVIAELRSHYTVSKELAADRAAMAEQGQGRWLASALYKLLIASPIVSSGVAVASLGSTTDARIDHLLRANADLPLRLSSSALAMSALVLLVIVATVLSPNLGSAGPHLHTLVHGAVTSCIF